MGERGGRDGWRKGERVRMRMRKGEKEEEEKGVVM